MGKENEIQEIAEATSVRISVADCRDFNSRGMTMLLELEGGTDGVGAAVRSLRGLKEMKKIYETQVSPAKTVCLAVLDRPLFCKASLETGVLCLRCPYNSTGEPFAWQVLVKKSEDLKALISNLEDKGLNVGVSSVSQLNHEEVLTTRQKQILAAAVAAGYFDFPRRNGLSELSKLVGVKPSTLSEILRSAERKIIDSAVREMKSLPPNSFAIPTED